MGKFIDIHCTYNSQIHAHTKLCREDTTAFIAKASVQLRDDVRRSIIHYPSHPLVKTGNMLMSTSSLLVNEDEAVVWVGAEYAMWVEYGTTRRAATPFWVPALHKFLWDFAREVKRIRV